MDAQTRRTWTRTGGGGVAAALALLAVWLLVRPALQPPPPDAEDWAAAAARIREELSPGDLIRIEPFWSTGGRIWFADLDGAAATAFRLLDVHEPADPQWLTRAPRVWIVGAMGYGETLVEELKALGYSVAADDGDDSGRIRVVRMDRGALALLWELVEAYRDAEVRSVERRAFRRQIRRVAGGPRDCLILADPTAEAHPVASLNWQGIEGRGTLWVRAGNTMDSARKRTTGNLTVTARAGDEEASLTVSEGSYTLESLQLPFEGGALEVEVRSDAGSLHELCLDGLLIGPTPDR
ncbi:MAG: hypothetical protein ABIK09_14140 [Pseudomonadota bacterium]